MQSEIDTISQTMGEYSSTKHPPISINLTQSNWRPVCDRGIAPETDPTALPMGHCPIESVEP